MTLFRRWYWISSAFFKKYLPGIIIGSIIGVILILNASTIASWLPFKQTQRIGRIGAVTLEQLPLDIQYQVSSGLTKVDSSGDTILDAAQTISLSDDATKYTVTLNPEYRWADDQPFTTRDINLNLNDVEVSRETDEVITFSLETPYAPFPSVLSQPLLKRTTTGNIIKKTQVVGLNDYRITDINTHNGLITSLKIESDDKQKIYYFFPTEQDAVVAYKLGKIDQIQDLSTPQLIDWHNTQTETLYSSDRFLALFFNTTNPLLQDKSIRQILAYATPKPTDDSRVISPISKESWVYNPQVKPYDYSPETATNLLSKLKENNPELDMSFVVTTTPAYEKDAAEIIDAWRQVGINATLRIVAFPDPNDYQVLLIGQQVPKDPDQYALWHTTQNTNITKYSNGKLDKLLEDGRQEKDKEARKLIYQDFQRFLVEDSPVVFIRTLPQYNISRG